MYLPAAFRYHFQAREFPSAMDSLSGNGFILQPDGKVRTKYTCGVAILQLPFYFLADMLSPAFHQPADGFSLLYNRMIDIAAVFYLILGLWLIQRFLAFQFTQRQIIPALFLLFAGTNLFYYALQETGMSHIYSFFLFALFLWLIRKTRNLAQSSIASLILLGCSMGLIVLIRPTGIFILSAYFWLDANTMQEMKARILRLFNPRMLIVAITFAMMWVPQLLYWKYLTGNWVTYSYGEEAFHWLHPEMLKAWFSPRNGLMLYHPVYLLLLGTGVYMVLNKEKNGPAFTLLFLGVSYVFSCWWDWGFGCAFGGRSYVEYLTLCSIPCAYAVSKIQSMPLVKKGWIFVGVLLLVLCNLKMSYQYPLCFFGSGDWDWSTYLSLLFNPV